MYDQLERLVDDACCDNEQIAQQALKKIDVIVRGIWDRISIHSPLPSVCREVELCRNPMCRLSEIGQGANTMLELASMGTRPSIAGPTTSYRRDFVGKVPDLFE